MKKLTFPKNKRLLKNGQFKSVLEKRIRANNSILCIYAATNECCHPRLGISITKSAGNAVLRNRLKRLIREAFRLNQHDIPQALDYLVMLSPEFINLCKRDEGKENIKKMNLDKISQSFLSLVGRIEKLLKNN